MSNINQFTEQLENLISSKTVIGDPIVVGEVTLVPIIKASFGFGGGGTGADGVKRSGGQGAGGGATVVPIAIIAVKGKDIELLVIDKHDARGIMPLIERIPSILEKMPFMKKREQDEDSLDSEFDL